MINWEDIKDSVIERYLNGEALREIAKSLNCSHTTVCKYLDSWGIVRRQRGGARAKLLLGGTRNGRLTVLGRVRGYPTRWLVQCDCGQTRTLTQAQVSVNKSCGCGRKGRRKK